MDIITINEFIAALQSECYVDADTVIKATKSKHTIYNNPILEELVEDWKTGEYDPADILIEVEELLN